MARAVILSRPIDEWAQGVVTAFLFANYLGFRSFNY